MNTERSHNGPINQPGVALLKTCQTCFHAKIRCDRTQGSGSCDRCLRLDKECVFTPSRRRNPPARRTNRIPRLEARLDNLIASRTASPASAASTEDGQSALTGAETSDQPESVQNAVYSQSSALGFDVEASPDPFERGLLTLEKGSMLLRLFRLKMVPYFPFVTVPESTSIEDVRRHRPCLCLAALAAAAFDDVKLQRTLSRLFNEVVATRMAKGEFTSIDLLQALLVHLAWAHYQPRPRRYSQHLHLATSIVADMRLDRSKNSNLWSVGARSNGQPDWDTDELRVFVGTYYLSSSSSIILQKFRHFHYTPYVLEACERLATQAAVKTDKYLQYIVQLQRLTEEVDDIAGAASGTRSTHDFHAGILAIREKFTALKSSLTFPLCESPTILLQFNTLELMLSQASPQVTPYELDKLQYSSSQDQQHLVNWLSVNISSAKSLISVLSVLPQGEEFVMTNTGWIMLACGLNLAVRLDIMALRSGIAQHLRRFLDLQHTIRQIVLRLEFASRPNQDASGDRDAFYHFCKRARHIEAWYLQHCGPSTTPPITNQPDPDMISTTDLQSTITANEAIAASMTMFDDGAATETLTYPYDGGNTLHGPLISDFLMEDDSSFFLGSYLFSAPFGSFEEGNGS